MVYGRQARQACAAGMKPLSTQWLAWYRVEMAPRVISPQAADLFCLAPDSVLPSHYIRVTCMSPHVPYFMRSRAPEVAGVHAPCLSACVLLRAQVYR